MHFNYKGNIMKKILIVMASIVAIISCGDSSAEIQRENKELVFRLRGNPTTLNPVSASDAYSSEVYGKMFESLLTTDSNLQPLPNIATNWYWEVKTIDGKKRWILTFNMKGGAYWSDGEDSVSLETITVRLQAGFTDGHVEEYSAANVVPMRVILNVATDTPYPDGIGPGIYYLPASGL